MFTGLIEEIGIINSIEQTGSAVNISVKCNKICEDLKIDDSIAINGVCLTVTNFGKDYFKVTAIRETLSKTTLGNLKITQKVNLERALRPIDRLGGHIVQGHVDCIGTINSIRQFQPSYELEISFPSDYAKYVVEKGSICIDGISLTIVKTYQDKFSVAIIPHTWNATTLKYANIGTKVNLEFDIIAKYIENMLKYGQMQNKDILSQYYEQPDL